MGPPRHTIEHRDPRGRLGGPGLLVCGVLIPEPPTLRRVLRLFTRDEVPLAELESRLRAEILNFARRRMPPLALIMQQGQPTDELCYDRRIAVCVVSQSSSRVYLRDKLPDLSRLQQREGEWILIADPLELSP